MADAEQCSAALAAIPSSSLVNYGIDPNTIAGSAASPDLPGGNRTQPGRVMFRDQEGRDVRAYAHNEPMGEYEPLDVGKLLYAQLTGRFDMLEPQRDPGDGSRQRRRLSAHPAIRSTHHRPGPVRFRRDAGRGR